MQVSTSKFPEEIKWQNCIRRVGRGCSIISNDYMHVEFMKFTRMMIDISGEGGTMDEGGTIDGGGPFRLTL